MPLGFLGQYLLGYDVSKTKFPHFLMELLCYFFRKLLIGIGLVYDLITLYLYNHPNFKIPKKVV